MRKVLALAGWCAIISFGIVKGSWAQDMRIKLYKMDKVNYTKGEYIGSVELKDGKLNIEVSDPEIREFLIQESTKEIKTFQGEKKGNLFIEKEVILKPGSVEHLRVLLQRCWQKYRVIAEEFTE